jgi:hypothetical protein
MLDAQVEAARILLQALVILEPVAQAWGLPTVMDRALQPPMYERLQRAGTRGVFDSTPYARFRND